MSFWCFVRNSSGVRPDEVYSGSDFKFDFWGSLSHFLSILSQSPRELLEGDLMEIQEVLGELWCDDRSENGFLFLASRRSFSMVRSLHSFILSLMDFLGFGLEHGVFSF